jgi:HEAT repeat protein
LLDDEDRTVRLRTVKLFVTLADATPKAATPGVDALADRLADDDEFYFVRARAAEALGYLALDRPDAVVSPEVLADLRIGLRFDEPEVKRKLAKALELVALGNPRRLRHHVASLGDHLADDDPLVRYHLGTALVAVGVECPEALDACADALVERLADDEEYVRGRAAEAIGLLARSNDDAMPEATVDALSIHSDEAFVRERVRFARAALSGDAPDGSDGVGSLDGVRSTTRAAADAVRRPDGDGCRQCGLDLPESVPPMCPRCGTPL